MTTEETKKMIEQDAGNYAYGDSQMERGYIAGATKYAEEVELLNKTIENQHHLMANAEQRGIAKATEEFSPLLKQQKEEVERLREFINKIENKLKQKGFAVNPNMQADLYLMVKDFQQALTNKIN